jgi:Phosphoinositide phospholipase C, Ca2+-dependent
VRPRRRALALAALAGLLLLAGLAAGPAAAKKRHAGGSVRMNEIQVMGTHNSYKRELSRREERTYDEIIATPGDYEQFLAYSHPSIPNQFGRQEVRGLELDLFPDPAGGLYAEPLVRRRLGTGPLTDPDWRVPGVKVLHIADLDYKTSCVRFVTCLQQVETWSDDNPGHVPLQILLELKQSDARAVAQGGVVAPPWVLGQLDALDGEIRSVFSERDMITPDDVRRSGLTLEQSVRRHGWPSLERSRGKVVFLLDNEPGPIRQAYTAGRPNLEGRVIFTNSRPGLSDAAFVKRNEPRGTNTAEIQALVRDGYLVRTRSDVPLATVTANDPAMLQAALVSGAQLISTDFPQIGMTGRYDSDYVARLPRGGPARCNPVNAPRGCDSDRLEGWTWRDR